MIPCAKDRRSKTEIKRDLFLFCVSYLKGAIYVIMLYDIEIQATFSVPMSLNIESESDRFFFIEVRT